MGLLRVVSPANGCCRNALPMMREGAQEVVQGSRLGMRPCYHQAGLLLELGSVRQWRGPKAAPRTY